VEAVSAKPGKEAKSGNVKRLLLPVERCNQECVAKLEQLLAMAKAGEIVSVHGIAESGGTYFIYSTRTASRTQTAGALLDAAIERLKDDE
jgi:hypothetical protein